MDPLPLPDGSLQALFAWLEQRGGVAGALLVAVLWISTLLRERTASQRRNDALSEALVQALETGSAERARMADEYRLGHDWTVRSLLDHFHALAVKRVDLGPSMQARRPSHSPVSTPSMPIQGSDSSRSTTPQPNQPTTPPTTPKRTR